MSKISETQDLSIPWEERPCDSNEIVWRYSCNPVIQRDQTPTSNSIFNSAVVRFGDGYAGVFRCDNRARQMRIHVGFSGDAVNWEIAPKPIEFKIETPVPDDYQYAYDPRVCFIEDRYYVSWCNGYHGPTIGIAYTYDFKTFHKLENAFLPYNRNGVLFPRKINGYYAMVSRPSDTGHTPFGDIFYSQSKDLEYWGKHRYVMGARDVTPWESQKIGPGPTPIETADGWLMIYHGVLNSCNGFVYSFGGAILDIDEPWKVKYRCQNYFLSPQMPYECFGDVPNVTFPCSALVDEENDRIAIYYGAADTTTCLAFANLSELVAYIKKNSLL
ncbi:glycoside hydrolase family 130 protein [Planctomycetota bacterium]|nr:glycoside hydrolase family 130 protein [Planctomycetota bacterium]